MCTAAIDTFSNVIPTASDRVAESQPPTIRASSLMPRLERRRSPGFRPTRDLLVRDSRLAALDRSPSPVQLGEFGGVRRHLCIDVDFFHAAIILEPPAAEKLHHLARRQRQHYGAGHR